jgi:hypothetical protein
MLHGSSANTMIPAQYARSNSEPVAVPRHPRGPPQKPKQSGHALWVGNLHPATTIANLEDHFSRDATSEIQSLFFMSKTNCAFVNYRSELACVAALDRFNGSRLHGARLVCRLKRVSTSTSDTSAIARSLKLDLTSSVVLEVEGPNHDVAVGKPWGPVIVDSAPVAPSPIKAQTASTNLVAPKVSEMFFILESLTLQDLEESVRNGMWTTQSHNEAILNRAFNAAENVYLIFSANRSGEYFGYARMVSPTVREAMPAGSALGIQPLVPSDGPRSIPTPATETAPRGRVVDDLARGTIFWEAELSDEESALPNTEMEEGSSGQDLGRPFQIEWILTARLPFYRTRGLRNPWNANKEVKIARDGTGLEPSIGRRLVQMFHMLAQTFAPPNSLQLAGSPSQMA